MEVADRRFIDEVHDLLPRFFGVRLSREIWRYLDYVGMVREPGGHGTDCIEKRRVDLSLSIVLEKLLGVEVVKILETVLKKDFNQVVSELFPPQIATG